MQGSNFLHTFMLEYFWQYFPSNPGSHYPPESGEKTKEFCIKLCAILFDPKLCTVQGSLLCLLFSQGS